MLFDKQELKHNKIAVTEVVDGIAVRKSVLDASAGSFYYANKFSLRPHLFQKKIDLGDAFSSCMGSEAGTPRSSQDAAPKHDVRFLSVPYVWLGCFF